MHRKGRSFKPWYLPPGRQLDLAPMPIIRPTHERLDMEPEQPALLLRSLLRPELCEQRTAAAFAPCTSRISREAYVRFCGRLGVKFPGADPATTVLLRPPRHLKVLVRLSQYYWHASERLGHWPLSASGHAVSL